MNLDEYLENLYKKYNYSNNLLELLKKIIPCLIEYYGLDKINLILSAIEDTEIHFQNKGEDISQYLKNYFLVDKNWNIPQNQVCFLKNEYILTKSTVISRSIIYIKQEFKGKYVPFDYDNYLSVSDLVHTLCHLVKSYGTLHYNNKELFSKSGLIKEYYQCDITSGLLTYVKNESVGIEEALNRIDEEEILKMLNMNIEKNDFYSKMASTLRRLLLNEEIKEEFKKAEFSDSDWTKCLGNDGNRLSKYFDEWLMLNYMPIEYSNDENYLNKLNSVKRNIDIIISKYENKNIKS